MGISEGRPEGSPLVSVVVPVYNAGRYLGQCLDSALGSTLSDIEVICVDDGSTDGSREIVREYMGRDRRVTLIEQDHAFAGAARNKGLLAARGKYVHFLDADDWVDASAYERWYELAEARGADVCECLYNLVDECTGEPVAPVAYRFEGKAAAADVTSFKKSPKTFVYGHVIPWNKLYLRRFLLENEILFDDLICAEDRSFYFDVVTKAQGIARTKERWVTHRMGVGTSLDGSDVRLRHFDVEFRSFEAIWEIVADEPDDVRRMVLNSCIGDSIFYYKKSVGTKYQQDIERQLLEYWRPHIAMLGDDVFGAGWYETFLGIVAKDLPEEYRDNVLRLREKYREDTRYLARMGKLLNKASDAGFALVRGARSLRGRLRG